MSVSKTIALATLALGVAMVGAIAVYAQGDRQGWGSHSGSGHRMGRGHRRGMGHGSNHKGNPVRHRVIRHGDGIPAPYANKKNPLSPTSTVISAGGKLYRENCASCHGATGMGDGEAGRELRPRPANLAFIMDKWIATDDFLFWSISEGGEQLKTDMPAFKQQLTEEQRWQIIHYLRTDMADDAN